jgi:alanine racemase
MSYDSTKMFPNDCYCTDKHGGILSINLKNLHKNYKIISSFASRSITSATVKSNGYGLGLDKVAKTLYSAGCRVFFVSHLSEAIILNDVIESKNIIIYVLNGLPKNSIDEYVKGGFRPVIGSLDELHDWANYSGKKKLPPIALNIETGFTRLGLYPNDLIKVASVIKGKKNINISLIMSHLACAEDKNSNMNAEQLNLFKKAAEVFPNIPRSICNSAGLFCGENYHLELVRPGISLYGGYEGMLKCVKLHPVVSLHAPIIQIKEVSRGVRIGYGATYKFNKKTLVGLVSIGYADGLIRSLSTNDGNKYGADLFINGIKTPIVGRISMDITAIDLTNVPIENCKRGELVEIIGQNQNIDQLSKNAGTISYELLSRLGFRFKRVYTDLT